MLLYPKSLGFFVCFLLNAQWAEIYLGWGRELGENIVHQSGSSLKLLRLHLEERGTDAQPALGRIQRALAVCGASSAWSSLRRRGAGRGGAGRLCYMGGPYTHDMGA